MVTKYHSGRDFSGRNFDRQGITGRDLAKQDFTKNSHLKLEVPEIKKFIISDKKLIEYMQKFDKSS